MCPSACLCCRVIGGVASAGAGAAELSDDHRLHFTKPLRVYEAHVGMASEELRVGTYREFARDVLPRVKALGYTCVQVGFRRGKWWSIQRVWVVPCQRVWVVP